MRAYFKKLHGIREWYASKSKCILEEQQAVRMVLITLRWDNMQSGCDTHCIILLQVEDS